MRRGSGADRRPPRSVALLPPVPGPCTSAVITISGASIGAAADIQLSYSPSRQAAVLRRAGLRADRHGQVGEPDRGAAGHGRPHPLADRAQRGGERQRRRGRRGERGVRALPRGPTARPSRGVTRFPVATAAVHRAFCSGVTCRSPWPMPRMTVDPPYHVPPFASHGLRRAQVAGGLARQVDAGPLPHPERPGGVDHRVRPRARRRACRSRRRWRWRSTAPGSSAPSASSCRRCGRRR